VIHTQCTRSSRSQDRPVSGLALAPILGSAGLGNYSSRLVLVDTVGTYQFKPVLRQRYPFSLQHRVVTHRLHYTDTVAALLDPQLTCTSDSRQLDTTCHKAVSGPYIIRMHAISDTTASAGYTDAKDIISILMMSQQVKSLHWYSQILLKLHKKQYC